MNCPICQSTTKPALAAVVLNKYETKYHVCDRCGYLYAIDPHWLDEAYSSAIASADTGLVMRNFSIGCKVASILYWGLSESSGGRYVDVAGGYGMLTRFMRDMGFDFYWQDKYCSNLMARGFEYQPELGPCQAVTAFEVLEHVTDPVVFVKQALEETGARTMIFSTELYEGNPPRPEAWWYYSFATGQHIGFFQKRTLEVLGQKLGLKLASANGIHMLSVDGFSERLLGVLTGRVVPRISPAWVRRRLGSKTMADHELMMRRI